MPIKEEAGGFIPGYEIYSILDRNIAKLSTASCALALACLHFVSKINSDMPTLLPWHIFGTLQKQIESTILLTIFQCTFDSLDEQPFSNPRSWVDLSSSTTTCI